MREVIGKPDRRYECDRCHQNVAESQFAITGYNVARGIMYLHPLCNRCRSQLSSEWTKHALYSPALHQHCHLLFLRTKNTTGDFANSRGLVCGLTEDDLIGIFIAQRGICALSGVRMTIKPTGKGPKVWTAASLDRIDSGGNYTLDNVHMVCLAVNTMKNSMSVEEFTFWCANVAVRSVKGAAE